MPEGSFFKELDKGPRSREGAGGEGGRGPPAAAPGVVLRPVQSRRPPEPGAAAAGLRLPTSLSDCIGIIRRRWRLIAGTVALSSIVAAVVAWNMVATYRAEAVVLLDTRDVQSSDPKGAILVRSFDIQTVRGEMEVLKSPTLAAEVADKLHLADRPEFAGTAAAAPDPEGARRLRQRVADTLANRLVVLNDGRSLVLKIDFSARTPQVAADIVNAYAEAYLRHQLAIKEEATGRTTEWLRKRVETLHGQITDTEQQIATYRRAHGITAVHGTTVTAQELGDINAQLIMAHTDVVQKEAALRRAREVLGGASGAEAVREVLVSSVMQRLRDQEAELEQRMADLSTRYRPAHPTMVKMTAELDTLHRKIADEANRIVRTMAEEANAARTREETLKANLAELTQTTAGQESGQSQLRDLERQAEADRNLYESLLTQAKQAAAEQDIQRPDAQIVARAEPPTNPSGQNKRELLATAGSMSLICGFLLAFALESVDPSFRRADEIEQLTGLPVLGLVPTVEPPQRRRKPAASPEALLSEALIGVRSGLRHAQAGTPIGILLVTSPTGDDGKTFFAIALGRSVARAGVRCLLIDCHFQRPAVAALLAPATARGALAPARYPQIQADAASGLHYIAAPAVDQRRLFRSQELFESAELRSYLQRMRSQYDLIILDAPPAPAASEVIALSRLADATVCLARWGRTPRRVVLTTLRFLALRGVSVAGIVLSRVDLRRYATYGYGDYVRYLENAAGPPRPH